jgi:hypothetical protein
MNGQPATHVGQVRALHDTFEHVYNSMYVGGGGIRDVQI